MPDCPYCDRSFEGETAIREHFYVDHDREELGRIDTRRVDEYLQNRGVTEPESDPEPDLLTGPPDMESVVEDVRKKFEPWNPEKRWYPGDIRELSSEEITDRLADLGIHTAREPFRRLAEQSDTAHDLAYSWLRDDWVSARGYDCDFVLLAAVVLWDRWADDVDRADRVVELAMKSSELQADGDHVAAYERSYDAWREFERVTDPDAITLEDAFEGWDGPLDLVDHCEALAHPERNDAWGDPARAEMRLAFCRGVQERFPAMAEPMHLLLRLGEADALFVLGRFDEADAVFESLLESDPTDARIYANWGNLYARGCPPAGIPPDEERANDIYFRGREADAEPGEVLIELLERPIETGQSAPAESGDSGRDEDPPRA